MDAKVINPFLASVQNVFRTMVGTEVQIGKPYASHDAFSSAEATAVIGLSGEVSGCVVLSFPEEVACKVAGVFAGVEMTVSHPDLSDAIGELCNMVVGNGKNDLDGLMLNVSRPSVVIGERHVISQSGVTPRLVVPCATDHGAFFLEVALRVEQPAATTSGVGR